MRYETPVTTAPAGLVPGLQSRAWILTTREGCAGFGTAPPTLLAGTTSDAVARYWIPFRHANMPGDESIDAFGHP